MKITVLDGYALNPGDLSWKGFEALGEVEVYDRTLTDEVVKRAKGSEVLLTNKTVISAEAMTQLPGLKYIGVLATGYNVVDIAEAKKRGIVVTNIPAYSTMSVAQRVFALLLTVTDHAEHYAIENKSGKWASSLDFSWSDTTLIELAGKTFGIYGLGNIGMAVAKIALAFGMNVIACTSKVQEMLPGEIRKVTKEELFRSSDIISLHCPLTPETFELINSSSIAEMKKGVILINTGRGTLVDEKAVANALESGKIRAFCGDVLSTEPPLADNPLLTASNSYLTPHNAWATVEARERLMKIAEENLKEFLAGNPVNVVNP